MKRLAFAFTLLAVPACFPEHDYEGSYQMTYDVVLSPLGGGAADVEAGMTLVDVRPGLNEELLLDLGGAFCRLGGTQIDAVEGDGWPYLDIRPQACWFASADTVYALDLTGTATLDREERLILVLTGSFTETGKDTRGTVTVELTETW